MASPMVARASVREIDLSNTTEPIVISEPGQYRFTGRFVGALPDGGAVLVRADDVDLDFQWASLVNTFGPRTVARAVFTDSQPVTGISVRKLKTRGFLDMVRLIGDDLTIQDVVGMAYNRGVQTEGKGTAVVRRVHVTSCGGAEFSDDYYVAVGIEQNVAEAYTEDCIVTDCVGRGPKGESVGISHAGRGLIQDNVIFNSVKVPRSYAIWISDGSDVVVKRNHMENYATGVPLPTGSLVNCVDNTYRNVDVPHVDGVTHVGEKILLK